MRLIYENGCVICDAGFISVNLRESFVPAGEQLKHENAQRPEVSREVLTSVENDLGCHVLGRTTECPRLSAVSDLFGKSEIHLQDCGRVHRSMVHCQTTQHGDLHVH